MRLFAPALAFLCADIAHAQNPPEFSADLPYNITVPDRFETHLGKLENFDGLPTADTAALAYDTTDLVRDITVFTYGIPAASTNAMCRGLAEAGVDTSSFGIFQDLYNARFLLLTPNTTTTYVLGCTDLSDGPLVLHLPPGSLASLMT